MGYLAILLGMPQGVLVAIWIGLGALANAHVPTKSRTPFCTIFMLPTIADTSRFIYSAYLL